MIGVLFVGRLYQLLFAIKFLLTNVLCVTVQAEGNGSMAVTADSKSRRNSSSGAEVKAFSKEFYER